MIGFHLIIRVIIFKCVWRSKAYTVIHLYGRVAHAQSVELPGFYFIAKVYILLIK